jgi:hypothetical protein
MPMRQHNDGEIGQAEVEGGEAIVQGKGHPMLCQGQSFDAKTARREIFQEPACGARTTALAEQIVYLGAHWGRNHQGPRFGFQDSTHYCMLRIARIS